MNENKYDFSTKIYNFDDLNESGLFYGGQSGLKLGVIINDEPWMLKFPKNVTYMNKVDRSYSTSPLSEYLGSHIFDILGYTVHDTRLGIKDHKLVVACKDFTDEYTKLIEYKELKNYYNSMIEEELDQTVSFTEDHGSNLEGILIHIKHNPIFKKLDGLSERFWETSVVDILINNNDRNSGNWGVLLDRKNGEYSIAPIFDNGGSFYNKKSSAAFAKYLQNNMLLKQTSEALQTAYKMNGHVLSIDKFLKLKNQDLETAILKVVPKMKLKFYEIKSFLNLIPERIYDGKEYISIMDSNTKEFYLKSMDLRLNDMLIPRFKEICVDRGLDSKTLMDMYQKSIERLEDCRLWSQYTNEEEDEMEM